MKRVSLAALLAICLAACSDGPTNLAETPTAPRMMYPSFAEVYYPMAFTGVFPAGGASNVTGISPNGEYIAGELNTGSAQAVLYETATSTVTPLRLAGSLRGGQSWAFAVNDRQMIAGAAGAPMVPVYWRARDQAAKELPLPLGYVSGRTYDIGRTASPVIVGEVVDEFGARKAAQWTVTSNADVSVVLLPDLGEGASARALDMGAGFIVGTAVSGGVERAVKWSLADGTLTQLGVDGVANDISPRGHIVGNTSALTGAFYIAPNGSPEIVSIPFQTILGGVNREGIAVGAVLVPPGLFAPEAFVMPVILHPGSGLTVPAARPGGEPQPGFLIGISDNNRVVGAWGEDPSSLSSMTPGYLQFSTENDEDEDGVPDSIDNCPLFGNMQLDDDNDGVGNECDPDNPPVVNSFGQLAGPQPEGRQLTFSAGARDPGGRALTYTFSFSDGVDIVTPNNEVTRSFADEGDYTVTVTVENTAGMTGSNGPYDIDIVNAEPVVTVSGSPSDPESGVAAGFNLDITDGGTNDVLSWSLDWGDGTSENGTCSSPCSRLLPHTYVKPRAYGARLTVSDGDGATVETRVRYEVKPRTVALDVWPGDASTTISRTDPAHAQVRVALLATRDIPGSAIDARTVRLSDGATGTAVRRVSIETLADVNADGRRDRVVVYDLASLLAGGNFPTDGAYTIVVSGQLTDGSWFEGTAPVTVVP